MSRFTDTDFDQAHAEADEDGGYCEYEPRARWALSVLRNRLPDGAKAKVSYTREFYDAGPGVIAASNGPDWTYGCHVYGRYICRVVTAPSTAEDRAKAMYSLVDEAKRIAEFEAWKKEQAA